MSIEVARVMERELGSGGQQVGRCRCCQEADPSKRRCILSAWRRVEVANEAPAIIRRRIRADKVGRMDPLRARWQANLDMFLGPLDHSPSGARWPGGIEKSWAEEVMTFVDAPERPTIEAGEMSGAVVEVGQARHNEGRAIGSRDESILSFEDLATERTPGMTECDQRHGDEACLAGFTNVPMTPAHKLRRATHGSRSYGLAGRALAASCAG